jgi:hypothetical protein
MEVYDINNNQLTSAVFIGTVGLDWQFAGIAPMHAAGASDLVLRNVSTGAFEIYHIANNQITGAACWAKSGWIGSSAASPPIRRVHRPAPSIPQVRSANSRKRWQASAAAQPIV